MPLALWMAPIFGYSERKGHLLFFTSTISSPLQKPLELLIEKSGGGLFGARTFYGMICGAGCKEYV